MDKAKAAVSNFIGKSGHHDTTVHETVSPAVTQEQVKPTRHEETQVAVDREIHQDHYHTTVQPLHDREVRPEEHRHQMAPVQEKEFSHENAEDTRRKVDETAGQFKNTSVTHDTHHTTSAAPTVEGERVHHHVHENVQPVLHKETITPEVVHTTVPVHETHHAGSQHHATSVLPEKKLSDFSSSGGTLAGGKGGEEFYEGCPRPYNQSMQTGGTTGAAEGTPQMGTSGRAHEVDQGNVGSHTGTNSTTTTSTSHTLDPRSDNYSHGQGGVGGGTDNFASSGGNRDGLGAQDQTSGQTKNPSIIDKLNPAKDADGDGQKGFMK